MICQDCVDEEAVVVVMATTQRLCRLCFLGTFEECQAEEKDFFDWFKVDA